MKRPNGHNGVPLGILTVIVPPAYLPEETPENP